jgi:hypothetical protein
VPKIVAERWESEKRVRKQVVFSPHAKEKIARLRHLRVSEDSVSSILHTPQRIEEGYMGRKIAEGIIDERFVARVVFEETNNTLLVVTVYPGSRRRYRL